MLLLVAERTHRGLVAVEERATVTRLGQGVDDTRVLNVAAIARTQVCLADYAERIRLLGADRVAVTGTSALRDASGGAELASFVESRLGATLRVITGKEEARLMYLGAISGLHDLPTQGAQIAFDVGGGSTELVRGELGPDETVRIDYAESFDVGSVRLTERFIRTDPPGLPELDAIVKSLDETLAGVPLRTDDRPPIGIAGTVTTLASISLRMERYDGERVHGHSLELREVQSIVTMLASARVSERRLVPGLHPGRADVIVAGGLVVLAVLRRLGATTLRVSDRGLRWGVAQELFSAH